MQISEHQLRRIEIKRICIKLDDVSCYFLVKNAGFYFMKRFSILYLLAVACGIVCMLAVIATDNILNFPSSIRSLFPVLAIFREKKEAL